MTDKNVSQADTGAEASTKQESLRRPFPFVRMFYALGFAVVAWMVFWLAILLAVLQFMVTAIVGRTNEELTSFAHSVTLYLQEVLDYVMLVRSERPFPFGPFPKP